MPPWGSDANALVGPVDVAVAILGGVPRHMVAIIEVLRDVQDRSPVISATVKHPTMFVGAQGRMATPCAARVKQSSVCLLEILRTVWIERLAPVRHVTAAVHDVMTVSGAVGVAKSTEVDIGVAGRIGRHPDVVQVLVRNASSRSNCAFVVLALFVG